MNEKLVLSDTHLKHWVNENTASNPRIVEIDNGAELSRLIKKAQGKSLVAIVPCEPSEKWWQDNIGSQYSYVYFVKETAKQFSNKAVVIFNPKYKMQKFPNSKAIVDRLTTEYNFPISELADRIGKSRQVLYRLMDSKKELMLEQRWINISILYELLQEVEKGREE